MHNLFPLFQYVPRPSVAPNNRGATTTASTTGNNQKTRSKVRQTMNGLEIQQQSNSAEESSTNQNGSENVPPPGRGALPPEKMETVSKATGASKLFFPEFLYFIVILTTT